MRISQNGIEFIKSFEGFKSNSYLCSAGIQTIGYGHVIKPKENFTNISPKEAEEMLIDDLRLAERSVCRNIAVPLQQNQFDALVSFVFNLGGGALQRSSLRQKINYGSDEDEIYEAFINWVYAGGRKLLGLVKRREAEAGMYLG